MAIVVSTDNFVDKVLSILEEETERIADIADKAAKKTADDAERELRAVKIGTGAYSSGWTVKREQKHKGKRNGPLYTKYTVYNATHYQLTHLLEYGHFVVSHGKATGKRTRAIPHIQPIENKQNRLFLENVIREADQ